MKEGGMVSSDIIVRLLMNKIASCGAKRYLIDGFPRNVAQAILLENKMGEIDFILNYKCDAEVLTARILHRAKTSGRSDDNPETLKARISVFLDNTIPTLRLYKVFGKVYNIDARGTVNEILAMTNNALLPTLSFIYGPPVDK
jgi:UMP-CMP kinase